MTAYHLQEQYIRREEYQLKPKFVMDTFTRDKTTKTKEIKWNLCGFSIFCLHIVFFPSLKRQEIQVEGTKHQKGDCEL